MTITKKWFTGLIMGLLACFFLAMFVFLPDARSVKAATEDGKLAVPVSINALMVTLIDHSAHYVWDYGAISREISGQEWRTIEYYAIQLAGSGPLITMGGTGPLDNQWASSQGWVDWAGAMSNAAVQALEAAKSEDKGLLLEAGNALVESCEGCHDAFKPDAPTEGMMHEPDYDYLYHIFEREL